MGIIKAVKQAIGGGFADTWQEVIEPDNIGDQTVYARGVLVNRGQNKKGSDDIVSNGSIIHVYDNQFMILVDGGKIVDYTAEPGYYKVSNSSMPSLFNGQFGDSLKETFDRVRFGGQTPQSQKVYYINLQEIKGIKFGTRNPINYYDTFYNAELFLRAHGTYSIKIVNPLQFYAEAIPKNMDHVEITDINEQYLSEFLEALQSAINQMSADGTRISFVTSKASELGRYMAKCLDESWNQMRGMEVQSVGIASLSYDEKSQAPFPGAFIPADLLFCAICVKPFIILPMVLIPMPTPMKPCIAPPLLLPAFLTPSDIFLTIYPCAIDGSESIAPSFLVLMSS